MTSKITTDLSVDAPLTATELATFGPSDRQKIDDQVRGCEQHLVDSLLSGVVCTWVDLVGSSDPVQAGDCGVSALDGANPRAMTRLDSSAVVNAGGVHCVFLYAAAPGSRVRAAIAGRLPPSITGLSALAGVAVASPSTGRLVRQDAALPSDYPVGIVDSAGNLTLLLGQPQTVAGAAGHVIQSVGDPMAQREALNFVGFEVTDTGPATVVTLPGGVETTAGFTMPAVGSNVSISMVTTAGLVAGEVLFLQDAGYIEIISVDGLTTITGQNIGDVRNAAPGTAIGSGRKLQGAGPQGPAGADGADGTNGTNGETGPTGPSGPIKVTVLTSGTEFVLQANTTKIEVEMWGGGGGGAGAAGIVA